MGWLNSFPHNSKQKAFQLLSSPEQQHREIPSAGLALYIGKVEPLPCPLPPSSWPWQHSQSFLAKSFSRNPSLSPASALGRERRQKDILRERIECQQLFSAAPQLLPCSHRTLLSPSEHPSVIYSYRHRTAWSSDTSSQGLFKVLARWKQRRWLYCK